MSQRHLTEHEQFLTGQYNTALEQVNRLAQRIADLEAELARLRAAPEVTVERVKTVLFQQDVLLNAMTSGELFRLAESLVAGLKDEQP